MPREVGLRPCPYRRRCLGLGARSGHGQSLRGFDVICDSINIHITYTGDDKLAERDQLGSKEVLSMGLGVGIFLIAVSDVKGFAR